MTAPTETDGSESGGTGDGPDPGSYRDPGGFVYRRDGVLYRQIGRGRRSMTGTRFIASGLAERLIAGRPADRPRTGGVSTTPRRPTPAPSSGPQPIEFISYPYEWTFGELKDAALLTLDVELEALAAGWTLKDASAYNVQFRDARPILIDSLSFEPHEDGAPWVAYRQFCEHFLAPLALMALPRHPALRRLLRADPDGVPLDLAKRPRAVADPARLRAPVPSPPPRQRPAPPRRQRGRRARRPRARGSSRRG